MLKPNLNSFDQENAEKLHFYRIFLWLVPKQQCRLIAAITESHLSDIGCGKTGFSKKPKFFRTLQLKLLVKVKNNGEQ